jgi:tRNA pseudouridine38-40 synthase
MRNLKITLEYNGTDYAGWQVQNNPASKVRSLRKKSIQEVIEKALQKILQEKVKVIASGRTDAGVHALAQAVNFKTNSAVSLRKIQSALNALLPQDIAVTKLEEVGLKFHAIRKARSKVYRYTILNRPYRSALLKDRVYFCTFPLNINVMRKESRCLLGRHDFRAFCASGGYAKNTVRTIKDITIKKIQYNPCLIAQKQKDYSLIVIDIEADGFLYNMVRNIVGTLIDIGRGRFKRGSLKSILYSKDRKCAGFSAPAKGLCLVNVRY